MTVLKEAIITLRATGKSYKQISAELGCSLGTVSYHLSPGQKEKMLARQAVRRARSTLVQKTDRFKSDDYRAHGQVGKTLDADVANRFKVLEFHRDRNTRKVTTVFSYEDVLEKVGSSPVCYLTGRAINLLDPASYSLDHVVSRASGGDSSLENLGIACKPANVAKSDLSLPDFVQLCKEVLQHNGFTVTQNCGIIEEATHTG